MKEHGMKYRKRRTCSSKESIGLDGVLVNEERLKAPRQCYICRQVVPSRTRRGKMEME
jgi:hypothetical protein